jgi:dTDP-glucose 4,6-dehydratase
MRVLITGVGGFVGSHVLRHVLETTDWDVVGLDSFRHHGKLDRVQYQLLGHDRGRYTHMVYDLSIPFSDQFTEYLGHVDYVLNLASESHVERSITHPAPFVANNIALAVTLLEWARWADVKAFVQVSTDEVYGPIYNGGHDEGEPHRPSNPYSASKAAQEDLAYAYWRTYGVPVIVTNTMNLFGSLQDPEKYVPKLIRMILRDETVTVHVDKDGVPGARFYMHALNQADALLFLLQSHPPALYSQALVSASADLDRFNVVSENEIDNLEMAHLIASYMGRKLRYEVVDFHLTRPGHDRRYGLNGSKMAELGWSAPLEFYEALEETVRWFVDHPEWVR